MVNASKGKIVIFTELSTLSVIELSGGVSSVLMSPFTKHYQTLVNLLQVESGKESKFVAL